MLVTILGIKLIIIVAVFGYYSFSQHREKRALQQELIKLNNALDHVPSYIYIKERGQRYTYGNKATLDLFGVDNKQIVGATDHQFFPPETVANLKTVDDEVLDHGKVTREEIISGATPETQTVYWEVKHPLRDDKGEIVGLVGISTEMTEVYRLRHELERRASTDGLTLVHNRESFFELASIEFSRSTRFHAPLTFLLLDIDHFKAINDGYGHPFGDNVLKFFAEVCKNSIRSCDFIGRIGGEEFAIMLPGTDAGSAMEVAERIRKANFAFPLSEESPYTVTVTVSIGLASLLETDTSISDVYGRADTALYQAKANGRNQTYACNMTLVEKQMASKE